MRIKIALDKRKNVLTKSGFPVVFYITSNNKKKYIRTGYFAFQNDWDSKNALPLTSHPNFVEFINYLEIKKIAIQKFIAQSRIEYKSIGDAVDYLSNTSSNVFYKDGLRVAEKKGVNIRRSSLNNFQEYYPDLTYEQITKSLVRSYADKLLTSKSKNSGNLRSPNGVKSYIGALRAIWNDLGRPDNPFVGIKIAPVKTKNKYLTVEDLVKIRDSNFKGHYNSTGGGTKNYFNYLMLCFYLGGIDMEALSRLRYDEHVKNGRIEFNRNKGGSKVFVSNKIFPEAYAILEQYDCKPYLVPLYKLKKYSNFLSTIGKQLAKVQETLELSKKPYSKAARYSFITRAQQLLIDERITIEIVGHSQNTIHSIYKDEFPHHVRDEAHKRIISLE